MRGNNQITAPWTADEDAWIRVHYAFAMTEEAATALPGRTLAAVKHRASRLGVKKDPRTVSAIASRINAGRTRTPENRAKISAALTGQVQSEATKRKRAETMRHITPRGPGNPNWKGDAITADESRWRARRMIPAGPCAMCAAPGTDVHHRDGNPHNNGLGNLVRLCAKHHRREHARMQREKTPLPWAAAAAPPAPAAEHSAGAGVGTWTR